MRRFKPACNDKAAMNVSKQPLISAFMKEGGISSSKMLRSTWCCFRHEGTESLGKGFQGGSIGKCGISVELACLTSLIESLSARATL